MWDFIIKRELSKTVVDLNKHKITDQVAKTKLNKLMVQTRENAPKGQKRELKNNIFKVKKHFKI